MTAPPALDALCATFALSSFSARSAMCAGGELDSRFTSLYAAANKDARQSVPTFSLALAAFEDAHWSACCRRSLSLLAPAGGVARRHTDHLSAAHRRTDSPLLWLSALEDERLRGLTQPWRRARESPIPAFGSGTTAGIGRGSTANRSGRRRSCVAPTWQINARNEECRVPWRVPGWASLW